MKTIGILLKDTDHNFFTYDLIKSLRENEEIKTIVITDSCRPKKDFSKILLENILKTEETIRGAFSKDIKRYLRRYAPQDFTALSYDDAKEPEAIDLIVDINPSTKRSDTLYELPEDGVVRILFDKNRHLQNSPVAFWEIYEREDSVGFCIEHIKEDKNRLLFKGEMATLRTVTDTKIRLLRESLPYLIRIVKEYAKEGNDFKQIRQPFIFSSRPKEFPSPLHSLFYPLKTAALFSKVAFNRLVLKRYTRFSVAFLQSGWENAKLHEAKEIKNPPFHFYADPFVWTQDERTVCFVEDYDYKKNIAAISAVEIFKDGGYKSLGEVLKEPFHLSFPYLFEYEKELYMIPESSADNSVRLYKCTEFPMKWRFEKNLMKNVKAADTMLFFHENRWWMLTNLSTPSNDDQAASLFVFYADSPLSDEWKPHKNNPVVFNSDFGRNAGILFGKKSEIARVRQKQKFNIYGAAFSVALITKLTPYEYEESELSYIEPDFFPRLKATHHMHSHNNITVYDFMRHERLDP